MRSIQISTPVFAAIWAARQDGEDTEDAVLARILSVTKPAPIASSGATGFTDKRFGVNFPEGFTISRVFRGTAFQAVATAGSWKLQSTGLAYDSLSALGDAIKTGIENVWQNWYFTNGQGERLPIASLRDPAKVIKRGKRI